MSPVMCHTVAQAACGGPPACGELPEAASGPVLGQVELPQCARYREAAHAACAALARAFPAHAAAIARAVARNAM